MYVVSFPITPSSMAVEEIIALFEARRHIVLREILMNFSGKLRLKDRLILSYRYITFPHG